MMSEIPYNNRMIFVGECIDNIDPMGLGRIRAVLKTENTGYVGEDLVPMPHFGMDFKRPIRSSTITSCFY